MGHLAGRPLRAQLDGYLDRIIDRDFPELGRPIRNPAALRRWMTAYAASSSVKRRTGAQTASLSFRRR